MAAQAAPTPPFEDVTETTGIPVTQEGARMMYTRYVEAAAQARGGRVLEIACGGGNGLGLVGKAAAKVIAGDLSPALLANARRHYGSRFPLLRFSAEYLPFRGGAFDTVLFLEASYYVPGMERAFDEVGRVLAPGGTVLMVNANPERPDFIRSPHSVHYHTADELRRAFEARGLSVVTRAAFPVVGAQRGFVAKVIGVGVSAARRVLETLHLVPRTLKGRAKLKRLVYRRLQGLPGEIPEGYVGEEPRVAVPPGPVRGFKVLYVSASRRSA